MRQVEDMDFRISGEVKLLQLKHRGGTANESQRQAKTTASSCLAGKAGSELGTATEKAV